MNTESAISTMNRMFEQLVKSKASEYESGNTDEFFKFNEGIHFCVVVDVDNLGFPKDDDNDHHPEWEKRVIKRFHVIMLYPHKIFTCVDEGRRVGFIPLTGWKNTSNHDSCWRDGCRDLNNLTFHTWEEAYSTIPEDKRPSFRHSNVNLSLDISLHGRIFEFVECDVETDYETYSYGYHKKISNIKQIKKKLTY